MKTFAARFTRRFAVRPTVVTALTVAGLALTSAPAMAGNEVFRWTPDDLTTLGRIAATHDRIEATARDYCRNYYGHIPRMSDWRACVDAVTDEIVAGVADARLTAYAETGTVDEALLAALPSKGNES